MTLLDLYQSPHARDLAVRIHREVARTKPNYASIPTGPWPVPKAKPQPIVSDKPVTAQQIVTLLRQYPEGLTSIQIRELLPCPPGYVSGLLKWRLQTGEIVTTMRGRAMVYRVGKRKRSASSQDAWRKQRAKEVEERT